MKKVIEKLQNLIYENPILSEKEKEEYFIRLEGLKEVEDEKMKKVLEKLCSEVEKKPSAIKEFFQGIDDTINVYLDKGVQGVIEKIDEKIAKAKE